MIRLMHLIAGLDVGGCQMSLVRLVAGLRDRFEQEVVSLTSAGPAARRLEELGIPVRALGVRPGVPDPSGGLRVLLEVNRWKPDLIQTWMYHSDLIGGIAGKAAGVKVVWGLHHGRLEPGETTWHMRLSARLCATLSGWLPAKIVSVSESARRWHSRYGYDEGRITTIMNGFDTALFRPDPDAYQAIRRELRIPEYSQIAGHVARFDRQKRQADFVAAVGRVCRRNPNLHVILCGSGTVASNPLLKMWINSTGCGERFHVLGTRDDIERVMAAVDVLALTSSGEGFGLCVGEAMACGVPCVVSASGELVELVEGSGTTFEVGDVNSLASAIDSLLALEPEERARRGRVARRRVVERYPLTRTVEKYRELYGSILEQQGKSLEREVAR